MRKVLALLLVPGSASAAFGFGGPIEPAIGENITQHKGG